MKLKFFDFEVFKNWWCVVISDEEDSYNSKPYNYAFTDEEELKIKNKMRVYSSDMPLEKINQLRQDIKTGIACGYNIKKYDLIILSAVFLNFTPHQIHILSDILIHPDLAYKNNEYARISQYAKPSKAYQGCEAIQDLMDDDVKGLKDKEAALGMDIRETTVPFEKEDLTEEDKKEIIYYCKHDVYALHAKYICVSKPYINTKISLCKSYNLPEAIGYQSSNAVLCCKVLGAERVSGTTIQDPTIEIYQSGIKNYIYKWVPKDILQHLLTSQESLTKNILSNTFVMADGGLHSTINVPKIGRETGSLYIEADNEYGLYNLDVSSCYPSCMIFCNCMSRGVKNAKRFIDLFNRRLKLKTIPKINWTDDDKEFVPGAKLVLNVAYGAMGNKYLPLYDDYMRSKVCRIGQLILLAIAHSVSAVAPELKIIQTNTDGILVYCKKDSLPAILKEIDYFEKISGFKFELDKDNKLWQLNVNNYIAQSDDGELKVKGGSFVTDIWQKGTNRLRPLGNHVIAKAQIKFYTENINPIAYLLHNENVNDLCLVCTKGPSYFSLVQKNKDNDIELGKVSRVIAIKNDNYGPIKKQKYVDGVLREDTCSNCPEHALVVNDKLSNYIIEGPINNRVIKNKITKESWQIDYEFYVDLLESAMNIHWFQLTPSGFNLIHNFDLGGA